MARTKELKVTISGDASNLNRSLRQADSSLDRFGKQTSVHARVTSKGFAGMAVAASGLTAAVGGLTLGLKSFVGDASDVSESLSKNRVLFGKYAQDIDAFSKTSARSFGISRKAALEYTGVFGNLFSALGVSSEKSAKFSTNLTKLAADMASFNNTSIDEALEAIRSGLTGETEPLRKFGVNLNDATLRQEAMALGLTKTTKDVLTPYQKAMAAQALTIKQTEKAHGDFHRTQGGLANQTRILQARFDDLKANVGAKLIPIALTAVKAFGTFTTQMQDGTGAGGRFVDKVHDIADSIKDAVGWFGRHKSATTALIAVTAGLVTAFGAFKVVSTVIAAMQRLRAAFIAVNLAMAANPVGAVALALIALGVALTIAYKRSEKFRDVVDAVFKTVRTVVAGAVQVITTQIDFFLGALSSVFRAASHLPIVGDKFGKIADGIDKAREHIRRLDDDIRNVGKHPVKIQVIGGGALQTAAVAAQDLLRATNQITGPVRPSLRKASGGLIPGVGRGDHVPALLEPGEFVMRRAVVERFGPTYFAQMNQGMQVQRFSSGGIVSRASKLAGMKLPYLWGGGHSGTGIDKRGEDCSGAVSYVLGISPRVSGQLTSFGKPGPGAAMDTKVFANAAHTFMVINGRGFGTSAGNPGGGPGWLSYNSRPGFTVRHLDDGGAGSGGVRAGDPQESSESGARTERLERAGSRLVNKISAPFFSGGKAIERSGFGGARIANSPGISALTRGAAGLGTALEQGDVLYGQAERRFGQSQEDLGTQKGRDDRVTELAALKEMKAKQLDRQKRRASALKRAIKKYQGLIKAINQAIKKTKGVKAAKMRERRKAFDDKLVELQAELKSLSNEIVDTQLDIEDLNTEQGEVIATPDTDPTTVAGYQSTTDKIGQAISHIDALERAGDLTPAQAQAARVGVYQSALGGGFGSLTADEQLNIRGDLYQATTDQTAAIQDNTSAITELRDEVQRQNNFAESITAVTGASVVKTLADLMSGQIVGVGLQGRNSTAGAGAVSRN